MASISNDSCVVCFKTVTARMHALQCDSCSRWQHRKCRTGVSAEQYRQMTKGALEMEWFCIDCSAEKTNLNSTSALEVPPQHTINVSPLRPLSMMRPSDMTYIVEPADDAEITEIITDDVSVSSLDAVVTEIAVDAVPGCSQDVVTEVPMEVDMSFDISGRDFSAVVEPLDRSLPDRRLDPINLEDGPTTFQLVDGGTSRGGQKLVGSDGYTYVVRRRKNERVYWSCSIRNMKMKCPAGVKQFRDLFTPSPVGHIHPADPGALKKVTISAKVKAVAKERVFEPAAAIVERVMKEMTDTNDINLPKPDNLTRAANHHRRQRPDDPVDLDFELQRDFIGETFIVDDIKMDDQRHIIMGTDDQLQLLGQASRWFIDGTFKLVKAPFYQLMTVNAFVRKDEDTKQVPLVYVLMSRRSKRDYVAVLRSLTSKIGQPVVEWVMLDFEAAIWQAIRETLPQVIIKGCVFHWTQRIWRKIQQEGLATTYIGRGDKYEFLRMLMSLPYLPAGQITPAFQKLQQRTEDETHEGAAIRKVVDYVGRSWIEGAVWKPEHWCVFRQTVRTNNDLEGWHRRLNGRAGRANLPFYTLVPLLRSESETVTLQIRLVTDHLLSKIRRKKYANIHGRLCDIWDLYEEDELTTSQLLRRISHITGLGPTTSTTYASEDE